MRASDRIFCIALLTAFAVLRLLGPAGAKYVAAGTGVDFMVLRAGVSPSPEVLVGADGWLYFLGKNGAGSAQMLGQVDAGCIARLAEGIHRRAALARSHGSEYFFMAAPDKSSIVTGALPAAWKASPSGTLDALARELGRQGDSGLLIDLRAALRKAGDATYFHTDTHWTSLGAREAVEALLTRMGRGANGRAMGRLVPPQDSLRWQGDLARLCFWQYPPAWAEYRQAAVPETAGKGSIQLSGDSFESAMDPWLRGAFAGVSTTDVDRKLDYSGATVVLEECVERHLAMVNGRGEFNYVRD